MQAPWRNRLPPVWLILVIIACSLFVNVEVWHRLQEFLVTPFANRKSGPHFTKQPSVENVFNQQNAEDIVRDILYALEVLQQEYFLPWRGIWPSAIDWTAAVQSTQVSGALNSITRHPAYKPRDSPLGTLSDNTVSRYFSHLISFYFGENALSIRSQAYDDMQWVVLEWIEAIRFSGLHSELHFGIENDSDYSWHGNDYIEAFAHRARIFWDLASRGWDLDLCDGGMLWSPYGIPYKNAITNELYVATSISMFLYFPGDDIDFPFETQSSAQLERRRVPEYDKHQRKYLEAAVTAYTWLSSSNMTNEQGLFADGFHIKGWRGGDNPSNGTGRCDVRDEMVYTYNQGVILTGQRGLWEATGHSKYLEDGHSLIRNVIAATGYHLVGTESRYSWAGLGRNGILEEACDVTSSCTQNGQTFKSIFFHHLSNFCEALPVGIDGPIFHKANRTLARLHRQSCLEYGPWITRNAKAALGTRDAKGRFGAWWTVGLKDFNEDITGWRNKSIDTGTDYRNEGVPRDDQWRLPGDQSVLPGTKPTVNLPRSTAKDPNERGRGRTVETQSGGLAVLGCLFRVIELQASNGP